MSRPIHPLFLVLISGLLGMSPWRAGAASSAGFRAEVVVCGSAASEHQHRGATYVEAVDGCEYAIRLINDTPDRVAVVLSVDGLNTIDASRTAASQAPRWVLGPYESATIPGWQTGGATSRRFFFTEADESYAQWLGSTSDAGWIRVVVYRERRPTPPPPVYIDPVWYEDGWRGGRSDDGGSSSGSGRLYDWEDGEAYGGASDRALPESEASPVAGEAAGSSARRSSRGASSRAWRPDDDRAATGIGREVGHVVSTTAFDAERHPFARISIRYGFRDQLVAWGVLPRPYPVCRLCCDDGFAPDPYDGCYRR